MTKPFDIKKYNSLCAEFLGFVNKTPDDKDFNIHFHKDEKSGKGVEILGIHITSIETNFGRQFTTDWNWIMEVIEAIGKLPSKGDADGFYTYIKNSIPNKEKTVE